MKYLGSKNRIAKFILPIMLQAAKENNINNWVEPFVGGGNMIDKVPDSFVKIGIDINAHVIYALEDIKFRANDLPESCTELEYKNTVGTMPKKNTSWLRIACSFGGKFEAGLASDKTGLRNYVLEAKRNAIKQSPNLKNT